MFYSILAIFTGMMIASQSSLNGILNPCIGVLGVGFSVLLVNAVCSMSFGLLTGKGLPHLKGMPFYCYFGGFCALFVLGFSGYLVTYLGAGVTVCLSVSGQLFTSAVIDHFGLFHSEKVAFHKGRIPGFVCILAGIFVINFAGLDAFTGVKNNGMLFFLLLFNTLVGIVTVFARMFNFEASKYVGKIDGSFASSIAGAGASFVIMFLFSDLRVPISLYLEAPIWAYSSGILGTAACICNMLCYEKMKIFHATTFMLAGQILFGILADFIFWGRLPFTKFLGILVISAGIFLDKKVTK